MAGTLPLGITALLLTTGSLVVVLVVVVLVLVGPFLVSIVVTTLLLLSLLGIPVLVVVVVVATENLLIPAHGDQDDLSALTLRHSTRLDVDRAGSDRSTPGCIRPGSTSRQRVADGRSRHHIGLADGQT